MSDFTPVQANAVHMAMIDMREAARKYDEKRPGCAQSVTFTRKAEELLVVRNMILDRLPDEFHEHRKAYPDYVVAENDGST